MRVLDNLENYDIPSGFHLTAEQEEQLAADLKEIVLALIPLRSSKLKTRQYFNSHLRYTSNVKYAQSRPDAPQDRYALAALAPQPPARRAGLCPPGLPQGGE